MSKQLLRNLLAHPDAANKDLEGIDCAKHRRKILSEKRFLRKIYSEWYDTISSELPHGKEPVAEIGAGGGFLDEKISNLITSDVTYCPWVNVVFDGMALPFKSATLRGVVMTNVFHHFSEPRRFLAECSRCLIPGGVIVMLEPWVTPWSKFIYCSLHHEPFSPDSPCWETKKGEESANNALPWIVFKRDRVIFEKEFPEFKIEQVKPFMPFRYLFSGGMAMRSFVPGCSYQPLKIIEGLIAPLFPVTAMFAYIKIIKS